MLLPKLKLSLSHSLTHSNLAYVSREEVPRTTRFRGFASFSD
jgi:hypothetical protein